MPSLDLIAFVTFVALIGGYHFVSRYRSVVDRSIAGAIQRQRIAWMRQMALRDNRIIDGQILAALTQGNAFFASTSAIGIGGLAAMLGSGEQVQALFEQIPYATKSTPVLWEIKLILMIGIFIYAFFKFAWASRLTHYAAIMIGATPIAGIGDTDVTENHAVRTAGLIGVAGEHSNNGIRALYYAIAMLPWFFHPLAFIFATLWVLAILLRRDFFSRSRRLILDLPAD